MFHRRIIDDIAGWFRQKQRRPLVIRGARQVGKTTAVRLAAQQLGLGLIEINLERHLDLESLFQKFSLNDLLFNISLISGQQVFADARQILLLDEAQATPSAYPCLRYLAEEAPELPVILTGSLLDQVLQDQKLSAPVGRVETCFMGPLTFEEYLAAAGEAKAMHALQMLRADNMAAIPDSVHENLMQQVRRYTLIGGMPGSVQLALDSGFNHADVVKYQASLIQTIKDDFAKYAGTLDALRLNAFFNGILRQIGSQFSHKLANEMAMASSGDSRQLNAAIERFQQARLFYRVLHSNADGIPLGAETRIRISKFLFLDIGLLLAAQGIPAQAVMSAPIELVHQGVIAEQFVGQQLLNAQKSFAQPELYYWQPPRSQGQAEVDFLVAFGSRICPVEVKSGATGTIKSLHSFVIKKKADLAFRVSSARPGMQKLTARMNKAEHPFTLLSIPFYLVNQWERLAAAGDP